MNKQKRNEKGFTMVELIIVVAIMGIIGALLVPAFGTMSAKARLSTDIATVKTLKRTADSYKAEQGSFPTATDLSTLASELTLKNYLDRSVEMQTGASIVITGEEIQLDTANLAGTTYSKAYDQIDSATRSTWCTGTPN